MGSASLFTRASQAQLMNSMSPEAQMGAVKPQELGREEFMDRVDKLTVGWASFIEGMTKQEEIRICVRQRLAVISDLSRTIGRVRDIEVVEGVKILPGTFGFD